MLTVRVLPRKGVALRSGVATVEVTSVLALGHLGAGGTLPSPLWLVVMAAVVFGAGLLVLHGRVRPALAVPAGVPQLAGLGKPHRPAPRAPAQQHDRRHGEQQRERPPPRHQDEGRHQQRQAERPAAEVLRDAAAREEGVEVTHAGGSTPPGVRMAPRRLRKPYVRNRG